LFFNKQKEEEEKPAKRKKEKRKRDRRKPKNNWSCMDTQCEAPINVFVLPQGKINKKVEGLQTKTNNKNLEIFFSLFFVVLFCSFLPFFGSCIIGVVRMSTTTLISVCVCVLVFAAFQGEK